MERSNDGSLAGRIEHAHKLAIGIVGEIYEGHTDVVLCQAAHLPEFAEKFARRVLKIERDLAEYQRALEPPVAEQFFGTAAFSRLGDDFQSAHEYVRQCAMGISKVAWAVIPDDELPGVLVILAQPPIAQIVNHIDAAIAAFTAAFPSEQRLNGLIAHLEIERARALRALPAAEIAETIEVPPARKRRLEIALDPPAAVLDGTNYILTGDGALYLSAIVNADGDWASAPNVRTTRTFDKLPAQIKILIEKTNKGSRIPRENLWLA